MRFDISLGLVSRYVTTWDMLSLSPIKRKSMNANTTTNLSDVFKENYPSTYAIIDGTETFIETPSDLQMQSSTWSEYKHYNTSKYLIGCTP